MILHAIMIERIVPFSPASVTQSSDEEVELLFWILQSLKMVHTDALRVRCFKYIYMSPKNTTPMLRVLATINRD